MTRATVPVTVLTGFLGAGKTTLVNRLLAGAHGRRFAVVENEFGEIGVDAELLLQARGETIVQLANGCICCSVRGDLANALARLAQQREAGGNAFDQVLIETSGVADPGPVVRTFLAETALLTRFHLDGVVTLFDALHGEHALAQSAEAQAQLAYADRIVLSKADLLDGAALAALRARLEAMNGAARVDALDLRSAPWSEVFEALLDVRGYQFDRVRFAPAPAAPAAAHSEGLVSVSFNHAGLLDGAALNRALAAIKARYAERLWRIKGVLALAGMNQRVVLQGVQGLIQVNPAELWRPFEPRNSRLVLIGRGLERGWVLAQLQACAVAETPRLRQA